MLSMIAAMGLNRAIGLNNQMPWHMPADLRHFKAMTLAKPIVMGRKTYESIGRPLPGRRNIVLSSSTQQIEGCEVFNSIEAVLEATHEQSEIMIIGGATLYQQCLPFVKRLYLTLIDHEFKADAYFPEWNPAEWKELSRENHPSDAENPYAYSFVVLESIL